MPCLARLTTRPQFLRVAQGMSSARGAVVIQALLRENDAATDIRVGFTATKKIGGAVVRNRAKRRLREAARALLPVHGRPATDYVFVARAGTPDRPWARLLDDAKSALISLAAGGDPPQARGGRRGPRGGGPATSAPHDTRRPRSRGPGPKPDHEPS